MEDVTTLFFGEKEMVFKRRHEAYDLWEAEIDDKVMTLTGLTIDGSIGMANSHIATKFQYKWEAKLDGYSATRGTVTDALLALHKWFEQIDVAPQSTEENGAIDDAVLGGVLSELIKEVYVSEVDLSPYCFRGRANVNLDHFLRHDIDWDTGNIREMAYRFATLLHEAGYRIEKKEKT